MPKETTSSIRMELSQRWCCLFLLIFIFICVERTTSDLTQDETVLTRVRRIIRGQLARSGQFPYQVSINNNGVHFCGGALIHERWILSAAHCLKYFTSIQNLYAVLGVTYLDQSDPINVQIFRIASYVAFPRYDPWGNPSNGNITRNDHDLVLLKLPTRVRYTDSVRPIRLPDPKNDKINPESMSQCLVSGFGIIKDNRPSYILKYLSVPIVGRDECARGHRAKRIKDFHLCAGYWHGGSDACNGDSGGPLTCYVDGEAILVGIVSWGVECARHGTYGVYTRVSRYLRWINQTIERFQ